MNLQSGQGMVRKVRFCWGISSEDRRAHGQDDPLTWLASENQLLAGRSGQTEIWDCALFCAGLSMGCSGFLAAWWLGSKSETPKRQEMETDSFLKLRPRNWQGIIFAIFCWLKQ